MAGLLAEALPAIEKCLPDWKALKAGGTEAGK